MRLSLGCHDAERRDASRDLIVLRPVNTRQDELVKKLFGEDVAATRRTPPHLGFGRSRTAKMVLPDTARPVSWCHRGACALGRNRLKHLALTDKAIEEGPAVAWRGSTASALEISRA